MSGNCSNTSRSPAILAASKPQLLKVRGIGEETAEAIATGKTVDLASELKRIQEFGCHVLTQTGLPGVAPADLRSPVVLYTKGELTEKDKTQSRWWIAHDHTLRIGSGPQVAYQLAYIGVTVVSGGARGRHGFASGRAECERPDGRSPGDRDQFGSAAGKRRLFERVAPAPSSRSFVQPHGG